MKLLEIDNTDYHARAGTCKVDYDDKGPKRVQCVLIGRLQSFRDKELTKYRQKRHNSRLIVNAGNAWLEKFQLIGALPEIGVVQRRATAFGRKVFVCATAFRRTPIIDYKNLIAGFDHMILDSLVRQNVLFGDSTGNLELGQISQKPVDPNIWGGQEILAVEFSIGQEPCSQTAIRRLKEETALTQTEWK